MMTGDTTPFVTVTSVAWPMMVPKNLKDHCEEAYKSSRKTKA
jgi:hypothetical protein